MQPTRALQALRYRRLRLTTKDVNKGFYKGTGTGSTGRHTKHGGFVVEWDKVRTYVCPPLDGFKVRTLREKNGMGRDGAGADDGDETQLTPFVTRNMPRTYGQYETATGPKDPATYLARWKAENGLD